MFDDILGERKDKEDETNKKNKKKEELKSYNIKIDKDGVIKEVKRIREKDS